VNFLDISHRETMFPMMQLSLMGSLGRLIVTSAGDKLIQFIFWNRELFVNIHENEVVFRNLKLLATPYLGDTVKV
jgi:hypothetical protein